METHQRLGRMTASADNSPVPDYAITCWSNDKEIFVALPMSKGGTPYIISFALNEGGLTQALAILRKRPKEVITPTAAAPANYTKPAAQPQVRISKAQERLHAETTPEQRANAQALLRRLGLVK